MAPATEFLLALRREMDKIREDSRPSLLDTEGLYGILEAHNLVHYGNSELAWTMNRNHLLPAWRLRLT